MPHEEKPKEERPSSAAGFLAEVMADARRNLDGGPSDIASREPGGDSRAEAEQAVHGSAADFADALVRRLAGRKEAHARYRVQGEIDHGGQGAILRVWDEDLQRPLALKAMHLSTARSGETPVADSRAAARFLDEAQVTGQLDHPGIVPVHELGLDEQGRIYFTMKLVRGEDLRAIFEKVKEGREGWTEARALGVLLKVCEAMAYAHAKGVLHRDLKPANVMVGRYGEVYVMDWGLARVLGREDHRDLRISPQDETTEIISDRQKHAGETPDSPLVTMDGHIVGTPSYMPSEQAFGKLDEIGSHSDVYAAGAMLYHLLAGHAPYQQPGMRRSNHAILYEAQEGPPASLHERAPRASAELQAICERAMAREWRERYPDMGALAEDLRAYLEHRVVKAYRVGAWVELVKWVERNKGLAVSIAAAFALLVAGLSASLVFKARSDRNAALAQKNEEEAKEHAAIARTNEQRAIIGEETAQSNEQRALAGEALAREEKERAERKADEVLRLSALQRLDDQTAEADRLWPAHPENLQKYEGWLHSARELIAELPDHERKLAELRSMAVPWTEEELARRRAEHPKFAELEAVRRHVDHLRNLRLALEASEPPEDPLPAEVGIDLASLPTTAIGANRLAVPLIDPDRHVWGGEAKGLVLARRAVELAAQLPAEERAGMRDTLAWALFANGRFDEAVAEAEKALEEAATDEKHEFEGYLERLMKKVEEEIDPAKDGEREKHVAELEQRIAELELSQRPEWLFADAQDKWWHNQLEKLVDGLKAFSDAKTGLASNGISPEYGWGVERRAEFARTIVERSVSGSQASAKWAEALTSIANASECPLYGGLRITPQLGLLPIGRDPDSGLWEFAHLQTGEQAERGPDGDLILTEATGLVFVLLPGGTFIMGAQRSDPNAPNYDLQANADEGPPREVTLTAFFLSKCEMTQGQWSRLMGRNPSYYPKENYEPEWNATRRPWSALHPVEQVSWTMSQIALDRMGLGLPSEAQWEYGARALTNTVWWTGSEKESLQGAANIWDRYAHEHAPSEWLGAAHETWLDDGNMAHAEVGQYRANAFGLHDVHGNVWEWCLDGYDGSFYGQGTERDPVADPGASFYRVFRGGGLDGAAALARSARRVSFPPEHAGLFLGVRPACGLAP